MAHILFSHKGNKRVKTLLLTIIALLGTNFILAQNQQVTGTIFDRVTGETLPFVTVMVKGTSTGTVSSDAGVFTISVPSTESVLVFSYMGYETIEIQANVSTPMTVNMGLAATTLEGVLITGFQTITRERATGAYSTISANTLQERFSPNVLDNLEGRVAGLVTYGGRITVRGTGTLFAEARPLLVVDGLPIDGVLEDLNPHDIESITILKDAAASAIYGARAANGVIVVVTKGATEENKIDVEVTANTMIHHKQNLDYADNWYMTPSQQVDFESAYYDWFYTRSPGAAGNLTNTKNSINGTSTSPFSTITPVQHARYQLTSNLIGQNEFDSLMTQYKKQNFAKDFTEHALKNRVLSQYNVAVRNRTKNFQSNLVFNLRTDNTGIIEARDNRFNVFYKGSYDMTKWLTINFSVNNILQKTQQSSSSLGFDPIRVATNPFRVPSYYSLFNPDGSYSRHIPNAARYNDYATYAEENTALRPMHYNQLQELYLDQTNNKRQSTRYHGELLFKIIEGLTFNTQYVYESNQFSRSSYAEAESFFMRLMRNVYTQYNPTADRYNYMIPEYGGQLVNETRQSNHWTARAQVSFSRIIAKDHAVDAIAGLEFREVNSKGNRNLMLGWEEQLQSHSTTLVSYPALEAYRFSDFFSKGFEARDRLYYPYIRDAIAPIQEVRHRNASGYTNLTYTYADRYNVFGSLRKDYADVYGLASEFRGAPFWSLGASWNLHYENFMANYKFINVLKPRISYGYTGNIYQGATSYMTATTNLRNHFNGLPRAIVEDPGNPELSWEKTGTFNAGVEFMLMDHRLRGVVDWYSKKSDKVFATKSLESTKGFRSLVMNMANVENKGVELTLAYDWIRPQKRDGFSWTTSATGSFNKNIVTHIEIQAKVPTDLIQLGYDVGKPVRSIYSFVFAGLDEEGVQTWRAENGDAVKDLKILSENPNVLVHSGQLDPKYTFAMENRWTWKGFSLNVMMVYYGGHHMRALQANPMLGGYSAQPLRSFYTNSWTPTNTNTVVPGIGEYGATVSTSSSVPTYADIFVRPADFLKIRNITLGYDVPKERISRIGLNNLSLRFQVDNLPALWKSNDIGMDPETMGVSLPICYVLGLNFRF